MNKKIAIISVISSLILSINVNATVGSNENDCELVTIKSVVAWEHEYNRRVVCTYGTTYEYIDYNKKETYQAHGIKENKSYWRENVDHLICDNRARVNVTHTSLNSGAFFNRVEWAGLIDRGVESKIVKSTPTRWSTWEEWQNIYTGAQCTADGGLHPNDPAPL